MDINTVVGLIVSYVPMTKTYIETVVSFSIVIPGVVTSTVLAWHGIVKTIQGISLLPFCSGVAPLAKKLLADQENVDNESNIIIQWISKLSSIKLPQGK